MKNGPHLAGIFLFALLMVAGATGAQARITRSLQEYGLRISDVSDDARGMLASVRGPADASSSPEVRLENSLTRDFASTEASYPESHIAVYFKDLTTGVAVGYRSDEKFAPASLFKVPVAMTLYKEAETNPALLDTQLTYSISVARVSQYFPPSQSIQMGSTYTVRDLIGRALRYSDNEAFFLLRHSVSDAGMAGVMRLLGVTDGRESISTEQYGRMLESLYDGTFLTRSSSDAILNTLANTTFSQGLPAGLPANVPVAHKFGEYKSDVDHQLHDCGVIYLPKHPYILCVMSRGSDPDMLAQDIARLSASTYQDVTDIYGTRNGD